MKHDHHKLYRSLSTYAEQVSQEAVTHRKVADEHAARHEYSLAEAAVIRAATEESVYHTLAFIIRDANYPSTSSS